MDERRDGGLGDGAAVPPDDAAVMPEDEGAAGPEGHPGPPEPPVTGWSSPPSGSPAASDHWVRPSSAPAAPLPPPRGRIQVLSVLGRSIDLFLRRPVPFLVLGLPTAILSAVTSLLYLVGGGMQVAVPQPAAEPGAAVVMPGTSLSAALGLAIGLVALIVGIALSLAMTLAADDVRAGREVAVGQRFRLGLRRTGIAILSWIAMYLVIVGIVVGGFILLIPFVITGSGPLIAIGSVVLVIGLMVSLFWIVLRWALSTTAIALEPLGPLEALGRSRAVTRGNVWRLVAVYLLLGLLAVPLVFGISLLSIASPELVIVLLPLSAVASLVTVPLYGIVSTTIFGDLTGRPEAPPEPRSPRLRSAFVATLVIVGVATLAVAIPGAPAAFDRLALQAVPVQNRGVIVASPARNPLDPCQPFPTRGSLSRAVPIYIGGYFTKPIPRGQSGTVDVYLDGQLAGSTPLGDPDHAIACWYEPKPLENATVADWRIVVTYAGETIAEGQFTVR